MDRLFSFSGRIGRQTYWLAIITIYGSVVYLLPLLGLILGLTGGFNGLGWQELSIFVLPLIGLLSILSLSFTVRRLHDRGLSGWWVLLSLIPVVGTLWLLVECGMLSGTPGSNQHGPYPGKPHGVHPMILQSAPPVGEASRAPAGYRMP